MRGRLLIVLALAVVTTGRPLGAAHFEEIAPGALPASIGVAWGDYDGDGYADLFLPGHNRPPYPTRPPQLYHNNRDLTFTEVGQTLGLPSTSSDQEGAAWADYNNDGRLDLLVTCRSGLPSLLRRDEAGFVDVAAGAGFAGTTASATAAWCDFNGDSGPDVMILGRYPDLYRNNGGETFTNLFMAALALRVDPIFLAGTAAYGDYDRDGVPDFLVARIGAGPFLLRRYNERNWTDESGEAGLSGAVNCVSAAWGDYDNDGWMDCYLGSATGGRSWLFHNNADGTFTDVSAAAGLPAEMPVGIAVAWGDYDNDGYLDLYVAAANLTGGEPSFLYHNNGDGTFTDVMAGSGLEDSHAHNGAAWADADVDGRLDLVQANGDGPTRLFHNVGPAGNWLRVRAITSGTGDATDPAQPTRDAVGAQVNVNLDNDDSFPPGRTLVRLIDGGSGHWSQAEQVAQFGLGSATSVCVEVRFPDGSAVVHMSVAANREIMIRDVPAGRGEIFPDVPLDYWAYVEVLAALRAGIVSGYPDDTYQPTNPVTRDQMAVYIARAVAGGDTAVPAGPSRASFSDVPADSWAFRYVEYARARNIVGGYPDGRYHPSDPVDRGQMAVFVARAIVDPTGDDGLASYMPPPTPSFADVGTDHYAYKHVEYIRSKDIIGGYPDGGYHPQVVVTRDQMAVYATRAFGLQ